MKLQAALVFVCMLSSKALALKCYKCVPTDPTNPGTCTETQTDCPDQCASSTVSTYAGGTSIDVKAKDCAATADCVSGRMNFGVTKMGISTQCCKSSLCNSQYPPALPKASPNGKQCFSCLGEDCTKVLNCEGDEDRCISANVAAGGVKATVKGCVSKSICDASAASSGSQLPGISGTITCCEGNLCNDAKGLKLSLFLILAPLLSSIVLQ